MRRRSLTCPTFYAIIYGGKIKTHMKYIYSEKRLIFKKRPRLSFAPSGAVAPPDGEVVAANVNLASTSPAGSLLTECKDVHGNSPERLRHINAHRFI